MSMITAGVLGTPDAATQPTEDRATTRGASRARVWSIGYRVALGLAALLAVYATVVPWMIQRSGERLVTITSGSMTPGIPVGATLGIHEPADRTALQPGQIITFKATGNGTVISHRIVQRLETAKLGGVFYQTKGDANRTADPDLASASSIIGVVDGVLPTWQSAAVDLQTPRGRLAVYGGLFALVALGEIADLVGARRRREPEEAS
ncbi:MAG: signal peptidase I [Candidatus Nanopelagicales bacterium]